MTDSTHKDNVLNQLSEDLKSLDINDFPDVTIDPNQPLITGGDEPVAIDHSALEEYLKQESQTGSGGIDHIIENLDRTTPEIELPERTPTVIEPNDDMSAVDELDAENAARAEAAKTNNISTSINENGYFTLVDPTTQSAQVISVTPSEDGYVINPATGVSFGDVSNIDSLFVDENGEDIPFVEVSDDLTEDGHLLAGFDVVPGSDLNDARASLGIELVPEVTLNQDVASEIEDMRLSNSANNLSI